MDLKNKECLYMIMVLELLSFKIIGWSIQFRKTFDTRCIAVQMGFGKTEAKSDI